MQLLGGRRREATCEIEPHLVAKDRTGTGAGSVAPVRAVLDDVADEIEILAHEFPPIRVSAQIIAERAGRGHGPFPPLTSNHVKLRSVDRPDTGRITNRRVYLAVLRPDNRR